MRRGRVCLTGIFCVLAKRIMCCVNVHRIVHSIHAIETVRFVGTIGPEVGNKEFYIHGPVHRNSILIRSNKCNSMQVFIYCKITLHVSGVYCTHHQEYIKL